MKNRRKNPNLNTEISGLCKATVVAFKGWSTVTMFSVNWASLHPPLPIVLTTTQLPLCTALHSQEGR